MDWLQVHIELGRDDAEPVAAALEAIGALAVEYRDAGDDPILEPQPGTTPLWPRVRISALLGPEADRDRVRRTVAAAMAAQVSPDMRFEPLGERDWIAEFNRSLKPRRVGDRLWICPAGSECPEPDAASVFLDPGLAFGSGEHPTTALCLEWLAEQPAGSRMLDYGCGSGILSIAAIALGWAGADAVDIDLQALQATLANAGANGVADRISTWLPSDLPAGRHDLVIANILSGTLIELAPQIIDRCAPGAAVAFSGVLAPQAAAVRAAYSAAIEFETDRARDGWVLLSGNARA